MCAIYDDELCTKLSSFCLQNASKNMDEKEQIDGESLSVVLKIDLHCACDGCEEKVYSSIRHLEGTIIFFLY